MFKLLVNTENTAFVFTKVLCSVTDKTGLVNSILALLEQFRPSID